MPYIRLTDPNADDEDPGGSTMTRLITDDLLLYKMNQREADSEGEVTFGQVKIDIYKLITLAVILCWGSDNLKARVLYNAIQTHLQDKITPNERMDTVFRNVILFSTVLMMKLQCKDAKQTDYEKAEIPLSEIDDDLIDEIIEDLFESIFGTESHMSRNEFLDKLTSEKNKWILVSEMVRQKVKRYIRARAKGVHVLD